MSGKVSREFMETPKGHICLLEVGGKNGPRASFTFLALSCKEYVSSALGTGSGLGFVRVEGEG